VVDFSGGFEKARALVSPFGLVSVADRAGIDPLQILGIVRGSREVKKIPDKRRQ
jgi:hypothetical protein